MVDRGTRGIAPLLIVALVALTGSVLWIARPASMRGESKRAAASVNATAAVEKAVGKQEADASAGVAKIGEANAVAPDSPSKDFIAREVPLVLSKLPAPDPAALLEAERRRSAVMEGRAIEATTLYTKALETSAQLRKERDAALAQRRAVDSELAAAAAAHDALEQQRNIVVLIAVLGLVLYLYARFNSISFSTAGSILADVKSGSTVLQAFDTNLAPWHHAAVRKAVQLATPPSHAV